MTDQQIDNNVLVQKGGNDSDKHQEAIHSLHINQEVADTTEDFTLQVIKSKAYKTMTNN